MSEYIDHNDKKKITIKRDDDLKYISCITTYSDKHYIHSLYKVSQTDIPYVIHYGI